MNQKYKWILAAMLLACGAGLISWNLRDPDRAYREPPKEKRQIVMEQLPPEVQTALKRLSAGGVIAGFNQALRAHKLFRKDKDYIVRNGEVVIIDEFTGRQMPGRRWSDGLHQAVEAKEAVRIERENQTLATITFQNYFRMYDKLAGMTGTAETEAEEFAKIYKLDVIVIPTHMPMIRTDRSDVIYRTLGEKWDAVIDEIKDCHDRGQPALVGTVSVENSELISRRLHKEAVPHNVLNAKYHEKEAEIVAQAGQREAVTIATNMAGRGTDIVLGPGIAEEGGLHIVGTERHEARRIDNQLRGRAGRQGDPGSSRFYLSLEDELMRRFGSDRISGIMQKLGMEEGDGRPVPVPSHVDEVVDPFAGEETSHNNDGLDRLLKQDHCVHPVNREPEHEPADESARPGPVRAQRENLAGVRVGRVRFGVHVVAVVPRPEEPNAPVLAALAIDDARPRRDHALEHHAIPSNDHVQALPRCRSGEGQHRQGGQRASDSAAAAAVRDQDARTRRGRRCSRGAHGFLPEA